MSGDAWVWLLTIVWAATMLYAAAQVWSFWREARSVPAWTGVPGWWPLGDALWRGTVRSCAVWVSMGSLAALLLGIVEFGGWRGRPAVIEGPAATLVTMLSAAILVLLGLMASVVLFNKPGFVVPPHLRSEPSALARWAAAMRRWRVRVEGQPALLKPFLFLLFVLTGETVREAHAPDRPSGRRSDGH
ncbi:MAG: hypothetical protein KGN00_09990 [Chloroflexota bacterium]|nr:hypothetical protein [Chloroflexota bacterium]